MYTFKIQKDYYNNGVKLYLKDTIEIKEGLTILVGCNGSGKTTLIKQMKDQLEENIDIDIIDFNNLSQGGSNKLSELLYRANQFNNNMEEFALRAFASEGESIYYNIGDIIRKIGNTIRYSKKDIIFVFFDAIDSGLSIDNAAEVIDIIKNLIIPDAQRFNKEIYFIISTNSYEFVRHNTSECFDIYHCVYRSFSGYENYRKFILNTKKIKDRRVYKE